MCSTQDYVVRLLDAATYTTATVSLATLTFFDEHSSGIVALCAFFTATSSFIIKWRKSRCVDCDKCGE